MITVYNHLENTAKIPKGVEEFSAIERFLSNDCFAAGATQKTISWDKFTEENLQSCYYVNEESKKIAFNLKLQIEDNKKGIYTKNWNKEFAPKRTRSPIEVNVYYKNEIKSGQLIIAEQNV